MIEDQWLLSWLLHKWTNCYRLEIEQINLAERCEQTPLFIAMHYSGYTSSEVKGREQSLLTLKYIRSVESLQLFKLAKKIFFIKIFG